MRITKKNRADKIPEKAPFFSLCSPEKKDARKQGIKGAAEIREESTFSWGGKKEKMMLRREKIKSVKRVERIKERMYFLKGNGIKEKFIKKHLRIKFIQRCFLLFVNCEDSGY